MSRRKESGQARTAPPRRTSPGLARRSWVRFLSLAMLLCASQTALARSPCADVSCSDHGRCESEQSTAYCLCDRGYRAQGTECVPVAARPEVPRVAGEEIARVARAEVGHDLHALGVSLRGAPVEGLSAYVTDETLWCSDFVAWIFAAAGAPLSGGYEGGWLVPTNRAIRRWFEQRGRWVGRDAAVASGFEPMPGDYIRIHTATWGHSAIVERVEGDTLHLVEGNAGGRVRATIYRFWRTHPKVDGFGIVSDAARRSVWRPFLPADIAAMLLRP